MIVDMHAHALSERFLANLTRAPVAGLSCVRHDRGEFVLSRDGVPIGKSVDKNLHDLPTRIATLKRRCVERQVFGPLPGLLAGPGFAADARLVRELHRQQDEIVADSDGLMEAAAALALGEPDKACDELKRAVEDHGYRSAMIPTTAGSRALDDEAFSPLFALVEKLGITLIMHPVSATSPEAFGKFVVQVLVGWPGETTLAVSRMIFAGIFERHPALKLVLVDGGGNLVFQKGRLDSAFEAKGWESDPYFTDNIENPPSYYLRRLYFDTCTLSTDSNRFVIESMGADRVVFGSDYPFDIGDPEGRRSVPVIDALPEVDREKVYRSNAIRLLKR
jgi:aminocarboxymuconate-semialdehyde decarboxylase